MTNKIITKERAQEILDQFGLPGNTSIELAQVLYDHFLAKGITLSKEELKKLDAALHIVIWSENIEENNHEHGKI